MPLLILGNIHIPTEALDGFSQGYYPLHRTNMVRMADGTVDVRKLWLADKLQTRISAHGWVPPGFGSLSRGDQVLVSCAMPTSHQSATNEVTLPANRRSDADFTPVGFAIVDGDMVETTVDDITDNVATLGTVAGADAYVAHIWPEFTAVVTEKTEVGDAASSGVAWDITLEQA